MSTVHDPMRAAISLHGLGFIQVQLQGNQRLHVWHPELPRRRCFEHSAIHNHRFSFASTVLVGSMLNITYIPWTTTLDDADGRPVNIGKYMTYTHEGPRSTNGGRPWTPHLQVDFDQTGTDHITAGSEYRMRAYAYHRTEPRGDGKVATLMRKLSEGNTGASSSCLIGVEPDTDFDRFQLTPSELWEYVADVLGGASLLHPAQQEMRQ